MLLRTSRGGKFERPHRLEVQAGTTTVDLVRPPFYLDIWKPSNPQYKGGGVRADSPIADRSTLAFTRWGNQAEVIAYKIITTALDRCIWHDRQLKSILELAADFMKNAWSATPVYLVAQGYGETNVRYALIVRGFVKDAPFPYGEPTIKNGQVIFEKQAAQIEHMGWMADKLDSPTAVAISALEAYDGRNLGNIDSADAREPTTGAKEVFVANKRVVANLSDAYEFNATGSVWSSNLMDDDYSGNVIILQTAVGSALYLGIDTTLTDSGPFDNIVFNINEIATGGSYATIWEYYDGATWSTLTVRDNTDAQAAKDGSQAFTTLGVNSLHWDVPTDWATVNLLSDLGGSAPNITGYWVRCRITGVSTALVFQVSRPPYSVIWPYVEIQNTEIDGDLPALATILVENRLHDGRLEDRDKIARIVIGARSMSRGEDFTAYINAADEQNPAGITITGDTYQNDVEMPTGRRIWTQSVLSTSATIFTVTIDNTIADQYYGTFHAFVRTVDIPDSTDSLQLQITKPNIWEKTIAPPTTTYEDHMLVWDFGEVTIGHPSWIPGEVGQEIEIKVRIISTSNPTQGYGGDLILIPSDEWLADTNHDGVAAAINGEVSSVYSRNQLDSIAIFPRKRLRSRIEVASSGDHLYAWRTKANAPAVIQVASKMRLWFFTACPAGETGSGDDAVNAFGNLVTSVNITKLQRYKNHRGDE